MYYCSLILQDHAWPWMEELGVLPHLEAEDLAKFVPVMLSRAFLECYIAGSYKSLNFLCKFYLITAILYYCHIMIPNVWVWHVTAAARMKELHLLVCRALYWRACKRGALSTELEPLIKCYNFPPIHGSRNYSYPIKLQWLFHLK